MVQEFNLFESIEDQIEKVEKQAQEKIEKKAQEIIDREKRLEELKNKVEVTKVDAKPKKETFKGIREIKVYGNVVYTEENHKVKDDEIRQRLVDEFGYGELTKEITAFNLVIDSSDELKAILLVGPTFNKKG